MGRIRDLLGGGEGNDSPPEQVRRDLAMFREASFVRDDVQAPAIDEMYRRYAYLEYFLGAARFAAVQRGLDEEAFLAIGEEHLRQVGATTGEVESLLSDLLYRRFKPRGREAFEEGARAIELWQIGKDVDAPLRLSQLLHEW